MACRPCCACCATLVCSNAGTNAYRVGPLASQDPEDIVRVVETNVLGVMLCECVAPRAGAMRSFVRPPQLGWRAAGGHNGPGMTGGRATEDVLASAAGCLVVPCLRAWPVGCGWGFGGPIGARRCGCCLRQRFCAQGCGRGSCGMRGCLSDPGLELGPSLSGVGATRSAWGTRRLAAAPASPRARHAPLRMLGAYAMFTCTPLSRLQDFLRHERCGCPYAAVRARLSSYFWVTLKHETLQTCMQAARRRSAS